MYFVNDINFKTAATGPDRAVFTQRADVFDAVVTGSVNLNNIDIQPFGNRLTNITLFTGFNGRTTLTIQCFGKDPSSGRLACSAWAGKEICVPNSI